MRTDLLVERLSRDLRPVRRRSVARETAMLLLLGALEVAAFFGTGLMRPDLPMAMHVASFWWKLASMGLLAVLGGAVALLSADPARSPQTGLRWLLACLCKRLAGGRLSHRTDGVRPSA